MKFRTQTLERVKNNPLVTIESLNPYGLLVRPLEPFGRCHGGLRVSNYSFGESIETNNGISNRNSVDEFIYLNNLATKYVFIKTIEEYL